MKISLVGFSGCGKTSIYLTTLGGMAPTEVKEIRMWLCVEIICKLKERNKNTLNHI